MTREPYHDDWGEEHASERRCELCGASIVDGVPDHGSETVAQVFRWVANAMQIDAVGTFVLLKRACEPGAPLDRLAKDMAAMLRTARGRYSKQAVELRCQKLEREFPGIKHILRPVASKGER